MPLYFHLAQLVGLTKHPAYQLCQTQQHCHNIAGTIGRPSIRWDLPIMLGEIIIAQLVGPVKNLDGNQTCFKTHFFPPAKVNGDHKVLVKKYCKYTSLNLGVYYCFWYLYCLGLSHLQPKPKDLALQAATTHREASLSQRGWLSHRVLINLPKY